MPILAQNMAAGTPVFQGTPIAMSQLTTGQLQGSQEVPAQAPMVHLAPMGYARLPQWMALSCCNKDSGELTRCRLVVLHLCIFCG